MVANPGESAATPPEDRKRVHRMIEATVPAPLLRAASRLLPRGVKRAVNAVITSSGAALIESSLAKRSERRHGEGRRPIRLAELEGDLAAAGLPDGAVVFVHSSLSKLGFVEGGAATVLAALESAVVARGGTLAMPAFTMTGSMYETLRSGPRFDARMTPTGMGKIAETLRQDPRARRSIHPTHSVVALGPRADWLVADHHHSPFAFDADSPLGRVLEADGWLMGLGTDLGPVTFYHVLEDLRGDSFPFPVYTPDSPIVREVTGWDGETVKVAVMAHSSVVSADRIDKPTGAGVRGHITRYLERDGGLRWIKLGDGEAWVIRAADMFTCLECLMVQGVTIYRDPNEGTVPDEEKEVFGAGSRISAQDNQRRAASA
ncbi:aminoglycoside N(3')-acetyltransferase [Skermanella stibiiresistens SB22]|uniref:Aminoglycoside N(3)-acetyltransferase n=1 Tax=Skermanella stibiiresistens SB22 TaxID=1385369 RepID=W9HBL9_9PROT|nr:AAC(3) family N-acetyltransferase [Skermanella stibiiresistens]EWY41278.1 aminoglycoside N(3')-acetyltransferase [Skermanella stibiiresistens SB22]